jgi:uncharacterized membrane protein
MAPALTPDEEESYRASGRQEITVSALNGLMSRGDINGARELHDAPGVREMLTPGQQRQFDKTFADYDQKRNEGVMRARQKIQEAETIKGAPLTLSERLQLAGLDDDDDNPSRKIQNIESALGKRLTPEQKSEILGVKTPDAKTPAGKIVQDREMFVNQYGEQSPQVQAFDAATKSEEAPSLSDSGGIRKEFTKLSGDFVKVRDSFGRIAEAVRAPSAAGDMTLIFNFMKMLDPGSTVREGEFANAQNAAGVPQRVSNIYNRMMSGERLAPEQREDFMAQAENLMAVQMRSQLSLETQFRGIAERAKVNPEDVTIDFLGDLRKGLDEREPEGGEENTPSPGIIHLDMNGEVIGGDGSK